MSQDSSDPGSTHFGFRDVAKAEKAGLVGRVFTSVADRYDLMNDLMSAGIHRWWKRHFVATSGIRAGQRVLDLAAGTGDIAALLWPRLKPGGSLVLVDINAAMLANGRDRLIDQGKVEGVTYVQADAEALPFKAHFDALTMAFGLRNVTDQAAALASMAQALRPGGRMSILEFSRLKVDALRPLYDWYSFQVLPRLGQWVADDADSYRYLAESIRRHPDQDTLAGMMAQAGLTQCRYRNLSGGVVAIHTGVKP